MVSTTPLCKEKTGQRIENLKITTLAELNPGRPLKSNSRKAHTTCPATPGLNPSLSTLFSKMSYLEIIPYL